MITRQPFIRLVLYALLYATLGASGYYKYQDDMTTQDNEVVEHVKKSYTAGVDNNTTQKVVGSVKANNLNVIKVKQVSIVDIFDVYKPPEAITKKNAVVLGKSVIQPSTTPVITFALPIPMPAIPATPVAPMIPFKYIGKILGDDEYYVFVALNGKNYVVKEGDIVQQTYKIEKITPPVMTLTYIPMNIVQSMQIGESN